MITAFTSFERFLVRFLIGWCVAFFAAFHLTAYTLSSFNWLVEFAVIVAMSLVGALFLFPVISRMFYRRLQKRLAAGLSQRLLRRYWDLSGLPLWTKRESGRIWQLWYDTALQKLSNPDDPLYQQWSIVVALANVTSEEELEELTVVEPEAIPQEEPVVAIVDEPVMEPKYAEVPLPVVAYQVVEAPAPLPPVEAPVYPEEVSLDVPPYELRATAQLPDQHPEVEPEPEPQPVPEPETYPPLEAYIPPVSQMLDKWQSIVDSARSRREQIEHPPVTAVPVEDSQPEEPVEVIPEPTGIVESDEPVFVEEFVHPSVPEAAVLADLDVTLETPLEPLQPLPVIEDVSLVEPQHEDDSVEAVPEELTLGLEVAPVEIPVESPVEETVVEETLEQAREEIPPIVETVDTVTAVEISEPQLVQEPSRQPTIQEILAPRPIPTLQIPSSAYFQRPPEPAERKPVVLAKMKKRRPLRDLLNTAGLILLLIIVVGGVVVLYRYVTLSISETSSTPIAALPEPADLKRLKFTIDLGERETLKDANRDVQSLNEHGYAAYVLAEAKRGGKIFVRVGHFATKRDAQEVGRKLIEERYANRFSVIGRDEETK